MCDALKIWVEGYTSSLAWINSSRIYPAYSICGVACSVICAVKGS